MLHEVSPVLLHRPVQDRLLRTTRLSDTWVWDATTWMAYDPVRKRIVLDGGEGDHVGDSANLVDRVWEYDGATWSRA